MFQPDDLFEKETSLIQNISSSIEPIEEEITQYPRWHNNIPYMYPYLCRSDII